MTSRRFLTAAALCALSAPAYAQSGSFSSVSINPASGTTNQGLVINQTLPSSGTFSGPINLNSITVTNPGTLTVPNVGWDSFGAITSLVSALRVNYATTGASNTNNGALGVAQMVTGSGEGYGAAIGITVDGNSAGHNAWGAIAYATLWPGAVTGTLIGLDAEVGISGPSGSLPAGSALYRIGVNANTQGPTQGSTLDAAFTASGVGNQVPPGGGLAVPWQHLMALSTNIYGGFGSPIAATGDFFFSESAVTVAHFANLPNVTVTGNILDFPNMTIQGNGSASFGVRGGSIPLGTVFVSCASCGNVQIFGSANGTNGADGITAQDNAGTNVMFAGVAEASNTNVRFGQTTGNWSEVVSLGTASNGLLIGTLTNDPLILGTNNTARMTLSGAGALTIPGTINGVTLDNTAWSTYTPTVSAQFGSPTVASSASGRYKQIGKTVFAQITVANSSNVSGASGGLKATLPITAAANGYTGSAYESNLTGRGGSAFITPGVPTLIETSQASASTWWVNNYTVNISVTYEVP